MPNHEKGKDNKYSNGANDVSFYDKIISFWQPSGTTPYAKSHKAKVGLKQAENYSQTLLNASDDEYQSMAGCDLSSLFYPFQTSSGNSNFPTFQTARSNNAGDYLTTKFAGTNYNPNGLVSIGNLLPYFWNNSPTLNSSVVFDRHFAGSGLDAQANIVSSSTHFKDIDRIRDASDIRSIGLRGPLMMVGWGFDQEGQPYPPSASISGINKFIGSFDNGWEVNPNDYAAAPVDLRYDKVRNVWTSPREGFWARILSGSGVGPYNWIEVVPYMNSYSPGVNANQFIIPNGAASGYGAINGTSGVRPAYVDSIYEYDSTSVVGGYYYMRRAPAADLFHIAPNGTPPVYANGYSYSFHATVPKLLPCFVTQVSGVSGSVSAPCTFAYTLQYITGGNIPTVSTPPVSPAWDRPAIGQLKPGTHGTYFLSNQGLATLWQVDETPNVVARSC